MAASDGTEYYEVDMEMGGDRFTRPSNAERDEDELLWAALERLPSEKRTNFALLRRELSKAQGKDIRTVDVRKLDRFNRELVVKNALATTDQDNYRLLAGIKKRLDRAGIKVPSVEVRFEDVTISAQVKLGSRALPTLVNYVRDLSEKVFTALGIIHPERHPLTILNDVSGIITPGRMTLLLGPPGAGKSTLLLALAGKLDKTLKKTGDVTYNGHKLDEFCTQRTAAYISQTDTHIAELTVRETLDFAARCEGASDGFGAYMDELTRLEKEKNIRPSPEVDAFMKASSVGGRTHSVSTDYVLKVLGLDVCADTVVGSDMLRGVSGGQRKRVTTGEMGVADFLQEVTSKKDQEQYWADSSKPYVYVPVQKIAEAFKNSRLGSALKSTLSVHYDRTNSHPSALAKKRFAVSKRELFKATLAREVLLVKRHSFLYIFRTCQVAFVGFVACTIFLRTRLHPTDVSNGNLYLSLVEAVAWSCVTYYTVGFANSPGRFFRYMFLLFAMHQMALGLFRSIASMSRDIIIANTFGSAGLLIVFVLGGFIVPKGMIKPWWIWAYWVSPLSYGQNAISVNEFTAKRWMEKPAAGNTTLGSFILNAHSTPTDKNWYWLGVCVLLLYAIFFNIVVTLALTYLNPIRKAQTIIPLDAEAENSADAGSQTTNSNTAKKKGMILPFQPLTMTFHDIDYYVDMPKEMQSKANLRLPKEVTKEKRLEFVEEVMSLVELDSLRNALVGLPAFDELLLMKRGGRVIYGGKLGEKSQTMINYFQGMNGVSPIPDGYNPATWMLEVSTPAAEERLGIDFAETYRSSDQFREVEASIKQYSIPPEGSRPLHFDSTYSQNLISQFKICLWKQNLVYFRSPNYNAVRILFTIGSALIIGSVFWDRGSKRGTTQERESSWNVFSNPLCNCSGTGGDPIHFPANNIVRSHHIFHDSLREDSQKIFSLLFPLPFTHYGISSLASSFQSQISLDGGYGSTIYAQLHGLSEIKTLYRKLSHSGTSLMREHIMGFLWETQEYDGVVGIKMSNYLGPKP
ncbi:hypothetical protein POM88_013352 [Heracleum sosnowskyi]|uniref:AAA+ ATPase domain-containing protein n=1 Tax=Heracleum sosnowskyi TaxID=360622 RepID=A0AAD8IZ06_9APIA|nr:hypothetical protein POM88_013352 [Heracleum sosnowskyi]